MRKRLNKIIKKTIKFFTKTRRRKILSTILAILIVITSVRFIFLKAQPVKAAKMELTTDDNIVQIDVKEKYRAILQKGDTDDFLVFYDRYENDSNPDRMFELLGPWADDENVDYALKYDDSRKTTILESTSTRIRVRVGGCFDTTTGEQCLKDVDVDNDKATEASVTYTFTLGGVFIHNEHNFKSGVDFDIVDYNDSHSALALWFENTTYSETVRYGDGETESTSTGGVISNETDVYTALDGTGNYQNIIFSESTINGDRITPSSSNGQVYYSAGIDEVAYFDRGLLSGKVRSDAFIILKPQSELDSEAEREGVNNDIVNPDDLTYTTGDIWDDKPYEEIIFADDFETGDLSLWNVGKQAGDPNDLSISSEDSHAGNFALKEVIDADIEFIRHNLSGPYYQANMRFYFKLSSDISISSGETAIAYFRRYSGSPNACDIVVYSNGSGTYQAFARTYNDAVTPSYVPAFGGNSTSEIEVGTWYSFECRFRRSSGVGTNDGGIEFLINGESIGTDFTVDNDIIGDVGQIRMGTTSSIPEGSSGTIYFDDLIISTSAVGPAHYNEAEGTYTIDASSNHAEIDLDGGSNTSDTLSTNYTSGSTSIVLTTASEGFPSTGVAYIEGDKFSYSSNDTGTETLSGIPATGENSIKYHASGAIVSLANRHSPTIKMKNYRNTNEPQSAVLEGNRLVKDYDYLASIKPFTTSYFAQDLVYYSPLESTTTDVGLDLINGGCSFVEAKYGFGLECDADTDDAYFDIDSGASFDDNKGAIEFWMQPKYDHDDGNEYIFFRIFDSGSGEYFKFSKNSFDTLRFEIDDGPTFFAYLVDDTAYSWTAGDWVHLRLEWDEAAPITEQMKIFINGVEPTHTDDTDDFVGGVTLGTWFFIGNQSVDSIDCNCIIDELRIYDFYGSGDRAHQATLSVGGNVSDSDERLYSNSSNYTFDFNDDDAQNRGEYIWLGTDSKFHGVNQILATDGVGSSEDFDWEYWDGTGWSVLTVTDQEIGASSFTADGTFYFTAPADWFRYSVNGSVDLYYIRGHLEGGSYTTDPVEETIKTDIVTFQYTSNISAENQTLEIPGWASGDLPIAYWKFDEGYGSTTYDSSGSGNDGTINTTSYPTVEKQINIVDQEITSTFLSGGEQYGMALIDTANYSGATYYFEVVAKVDSGTGTATLTYDAGTGVSPSGGTTIDYTNITATSYTRYRSSAFSPSGAQNVYLSETTGTNTSIKATRIIIVQAGTTFTDTETLIEVGDNETKTNTDSDSGTLTNPKYFMYDDSSYDGTKTAYFEATIKSSTYSGSQDNSGVKYGGTIFSYADTTNGYEENDWIAVTEVDTNDTTYARITSQQFDSPDDTYVIRVRNLGITGIGVNDSVNGVYIEVERHYEDNGVSDVLVQLVNHSAGDETDRIGNNKSVGGAWPAADAIAPYGGSSDDWSVGASLTPALVQSANFGVDFAAQATGTNSEAFVDFIRVTVYYTPEVTGIAYAQLYNKTDSLAVDESTVANNTDTWGRFKSSSNLSTNWDTSSDDQYEVRVWTNDASATAYIASAKVIIEQTSGPLAKTESYLQLNNSAVTDTDGTYTEQEYDNQFDPNNFTGGTYSYKFESTIKTSNGSNAAYAKLKDVTNTDEIDDATTSEVTHSGDTVYSRQYSSDLASNNDWPSAATNLDVIIKNASTDTTTSSTSWVIVQGTSIATSTASSPWRAEDLCVSGKCLNYNGTSVYISRANDPELDFSADQSFAISAWVRHPEITISADVLVAKYEEAGSDGGYKLLMESDGNITFGIDDDNTSFPEDSVSSSTANYDDNQWHHVVGVKDGATDIKLYIDGQLIRTASVTATNTLENNDSFYIGVDGTGSSGYWDGFIDEVKIYRYARSADEIKTDYASGAADRGSSASFGVNDMSYLSDGLVGYWKMDEASADTCDGTNDSCDSSGSGNDGAWNDNAINATGKFGNSVTFDGTGDYISVSDNNNIDGLSQITLSAWVNPDTISGLDAIFDKEGGGAAYNFYLNGGKVHMRIYADSNVAAESVNAVSTDTWSFVTGTYDGETMKVYINGVEEDTESQSGSITTNATDPYIGESVNFSPRAFDGEIDDLRIYNRALSPNEIQDLYNWAPGPFAHYKFDEGTGTSTTYDSSGYGHDGSMSGFTNSDWLPGKYGKSLNFDYSDNVVDIYSTSFESAFNGGSGSVSFWTKVPDQSLWEDSTEKVVYRFTADGVNSQMSARITPANNQFYISYTAGGILEEYTLQSMTRTDWFHTVMTWNKDDDEVNYYYDGELVGTDTGLGTWDGDLYSNQVVIGGGNDTPTNPYAGYIDEFKVYNYARTSEQIVEDMNAGHPAPGSPIGSPIMHLKFDEGYGDTANDSGTGNNDGTITNATWTNDGKFDKALNFIDDNADRVDFSTDYSELTTELTVSAWVKPTSAPDGEGRVVATTYDWDATPANERGWTLGNAFGSDDSFNFDIYDATGAYGQAMDNGFFAENINTWTHVVGIYKSSEYIRLYVNGVLTAEDTSSIPTAIAYSGATNLRIGLRADGTTQGEWVGDIDELKIYNFSLTDDQVKVDYNQGMAAVWGATSTDSSGNATWSATNEYCPPGQSSSCTGPVGEWKFDEHNGTSNVYDTSENNYTGTINGSMTESDWVHGKHGSALDFDGINDYIDIGDDDAFSVNTTNEFTVEAWFNFRNVSASADYYSISKRAGSNYEWQLGLNQGRASGSIITMAGAQYLGCLQGNRVTSDRWYHLAFTVDTDAPYLKVYLDGKEYCEDTTTSGSIGNGTAPVRFGRDGNNNNETDGIIDEVRIYNYARTPAQIAWDYNRGGPVGWWELDECQGTTAYDSSGSVSFPALNKYHGTIVIGATGDNTSEGTCSSGSSTEAWNNGATGKRNASLDFDGTDDDIDSIDIDVLNEITITAWINPDSVSNDRGIVSKRTATEAAGNYAFRMETSDGGEIEFRVWNGSGSSDQIISNSTISTGAWTHIAVTFNDTTDDAKIYINGRLDEADVIIYDLANNSEIIQIGYDGQSAYFDGQIDNLRIYSYEMTAQQVINDMNDGAVTFGP